MRPPRRSTRDELLEVLDVAGLVGVDEGDVDGLVGRQRAQRLERRGDAQFDAVREAGALPRRPGPRREVLADVAAQQTAAGAQSAGDADRRVSRERADLDGERRAGEEREGGQQRSLVGTHLHPGGTPQLRRVGAQVLEHGVGLRVARSATYATMRSSIQSLYRGATRTDATQNFGGRCRYRFGR